MAGEVKLKLSIDGGRVVGVELDGLSQRLEGVGKSASNATNHLDKMEQSAAQTSAALRGVPAQFTDIVTSLQAGQSPLSVFLQQGGQLKDMFGGAGNAARALGGYVLGLVNPFTVGAAAALGLAVAYEQGAGESRAMEKALVLSGNQAGVTTGQMMAMAASIDQVVGTQGNAAEALAVMASGSKVGGESLERFTTNAIRFERVTGTAVEDTAKKFAELRKAPLEATLKLNESMGYLTQATYNQIKALTDEGKAVEAATVAQEAFDKATADMSTQMEANLGLVERSWKKVTGAVKEAWDSIKGIGRDTGLEGRVAAARMMVEVREQAASSMRGTEKDKEKLLQAENQLLGLEELLKNQQLSAKYAAERAEQVRQGAEWDKQGAKFLAEQVKMERDIATARQLGLAAGKSEADMAQREAEIRKSYDKSTASKGLSDSAKGLILYNDLIAKASGLNADFTEKWDLLSSAYRAGIITLDGLTEAQRELLKEQHFSKEMTKEQAALEKERLQTAEVARTERLKAAEATEQTTAKLNESNQALRAEVELMGLSEVQQIALLQQRNVAIILTKEATLAELQRQSAVTGTQTRVEIALEAEIASLRERNALLGQKSDRTEATESAKATFAEWKRGWEETDRLARDVFVTWTEGGANAAQKIGDTLKKALASAIYEATLKPIAFRVYAALTGSAVSGSALAGQAGGLGDIYSAANGASMLGSLKGWLTDFGGSVTNGLYSLGGSLTNAGFEKAGSWVTEATSSLSKNVFEISGGTSNLAKAISTAGDAFGYLNAAMLANEGKWGAAIGAGVGTFFGGPIGSAIGSALGGWVDNAFGGGHEYTTGTGISGTFSGTSFSGRNYQDWRNEGSSGFFGFGGSGASSGTNYSTLGGDQISALSDGFLAAKVAAAGYATALGASTESIESYSKTIKLALGSDAEANAKAIAGVFADIANEVAATVVDSKYIKAGETASTTLARLATSLTTVNTWMGMLRLRLLSVSQSSADAASQLADAFGGLDQLTASSQAYYQAYYTEAEKVSDAQTAMTQALNAYGLALPVSKAVLRDMVAALDLNTDSGRKAYAVLLSIAPQFAETAQRADQMATSAAESLLSAFTARGQLVPAMGSVLSAATGAQGATQALAGGLNQVHAVMLDTSSPIISFRSYVGALSGELVGAKGSASALAGGINDVSATLQGAANPVVNLGNQTEALAGELVGANGSASALAGGINYVSATLQGATNPAASLGNLAGTLAGQLNGANGSASALSNGLNYTSNTLQGAANSAGGLGNQAGALAGQLNGASGSASALSNGLNYVSATLQGAANPAANLGNQSGALAGQLTAAQVTAAALQGQIYMLSQGSNSAVIDIQALSGALAAVDTATFVATVTGVFESLAARISATVDEIAAERVAVREAALNIVNPTVMSRQSIIAGIASVNTQLPGSGAYDAAATALNAASVRATQAGSTLASASAANAIAVAQSAAKVSEYQSVQASLYATAARYGFSLHSSNGGQAYALNGATGRYGDYAYIGGTTANIGNAPAFRAEASGLVNRMDGANAALDAAAAAVVNSQHVLASAQQESAAATAAKAAAEVNAKNALLAYQQSLQSFAIDANKSVARLSTLRQETVKYFEAQQALAELMGTSAAGLRSTVSNYRYSQLSTADQAANLQAEFATAYAMAQATQGDGATLATYADKLNNTLPALLEKLAETGKSNLVATYLAQADQVAALLDANAPKNYQADSLDLLGKIDSTLLALDASSQSAEKIIAAAITAGSDRTAAGLYGVIAAIQGGHVSAFATGGAFTNGVVSRPTLFDTGLMGEAGPEGILPLGNVGGKLGVHYRMSGPAGGGAGVTARLEALIERQNQLIEKQTKQIEDLRYEARATAVSSSKTANILRRVTRDGEALQTEVAA